MITTETAFNEAFNLEKALSIIEDKKLSSQYFLDEKDKAEFCAIAEIHLDTNALRIFEIVFRLKKHNEYLINRLHKLETNP